MSENGARTASALRPWLARVDRSREQIAKAWLVDVILNSRLSDVEATPVAWATGELPLLISEIFSALGRETQGLDPQALERASGLAQGRAGASPAQVSREISYLQSAILSALRMELDAAEPQLFAEAAERLAAAFTQLMGATVDALGPPSRQEARPDPDLLPVVPLQRRLEQLIATTRRYGAPFGLLVLDLEGPGARETEGAVPQGAMGFVSNAVRGSIRVIDEAYVTESEGLCVLAPHQTAANTARMAHRLTQILERLERAGGLQVTVSTGVVACPEHGDDPSQLLHAADTAMWRARATGQPVTVGGLQDR
jgi:diguanylate cyclase (GGDEF)-like protein